MTPAAATSGIAGEGLAFVVTAAAPQGAAAGVGLGGVGKRSVAVEFDSVLSVKHSDPNDNHVGVNVGGSPVSLASATAPLILNDAHTKHAWIHYDPTSGGTLRVFLSASRQQQSKAVVTARVSLCSALKPTVGDSSFLFGFVGSSLNNTQRHDIRSWSIVTGILPAVDWKNEAPGKHIFPNAFPLACMDAVWHGCGMAWMQHGMAWMRYDGMAQIRYGMDRCRLAGYGIGTKTTIQQPHQPPLTLPVSLPPRPSLPAHTRPAADSSAYAVVAAVEAAYSITSNGSQPPRLSVEQFRLALSAKCDDMPPRDVLAFLVAATRKGGGLMDDAAAAPASPHSMASTGRRERLATVSRSQ
ncbi:unnamed protein product [Closterium sp. Yama58-4]|nr:unnamed protein product [Closterium sp. Yama58-4]